MIKKKQKKRIDGKHCLYLLMILKLSYFVNFVKKKMFGVYSVLPSSIFVVYNENFILNSKKSRVSFLLLTSICI